MLRNKLFGFFVFSILTLTSLQAADRRNFSVHGAVGLFFSNPIIVGYGGGLSYRASENFGIGAEYFGASGTISNITASFGLIPLDFKFYMLDGNFYVGPSIGLAMLNVTASGTSGFNSGTITTFLIGGSAGYEWDFYENSSLSIGIVPEFRLSMVAIVIPMIDASLKLRVSF